MPLKREFLGWEKFPLSSAAKWIAAEFGLDLSGLIIVVPIRRAGRRLIEILAEIGDGSLVPPRLVTPGELPEALYNEISSAASETERLFARIESLRAAPSEILSQVIPLPPEDADLPGWARVAREINRLADSLAAERHDFRSAREALISGLGRFPDEIRWQALESLQRLYVVCLSSYGLVDRNDLRERALAESAGSTVSKIVLLGCPDLSRLTAAMVRNCAKSARCDVLIAAPETEQDFFDDLGRVINAKWMNREIDIRPDKIIVADRPRDQIEALLQLLSGAGNLSPDEITVGLGDESAAERVSRALTLARVPSRAATGTPIRRTAPFRLLEAVSNFLSALQMSDLAELVRHPDFEAAITSRISNQDSAEPRLLQIIDSYREETLQLKAHGGWIGDHADEMKRIAAAIAEILPPSADESRGITDRAKEISGILLSIYGDTKINTLSGDGRTLAKSLTSLSDALRLLTNNRCSGSSCATALPGAITFLLDQVTSMTIPEAGGNAAVEILGWLELQLDDAEKIIVLDVNEGRIPAGGLADPFLPDHARSILGLPDADHRYARDAMILTALVAGGRDVTLVSGKYSADGEPVMPSRLLLTGRGDSYLRRIAKFYGDDASSLISARPLLKSADMMNLKIPCPDSGKKLPRSFSVTSFRDYLACPYRYYLRHVCGLVSQGDADIELSPRAYGILIHDVLEIFAVSTLKDSPDEGSIRRFLEKQIVRLAKDRFGASLPAAVALQIEYAQDRLAAFSRWQSEQSGEGWKIVESERKYAASIDVDGRSCQISGKIDRVDRGPKGQIRVYDYKTAGTLAKPDAMHRRSDGTKKKWVDLQLPLYRTLLRENGYGQDPQLGYIVLPANVGDTGSVMADWTPAELVEADDTARDVVKGILARRFWPPSDPRNLPPWDDGFGRICMDSYMDRSKAVERSHG